MRLAGSGLCSLALGTLHLGCAPPNIAADPVAPGAPELGEAQCSAVRPQTEPDLMAWDPGSRANLSRLRQEGIVAVRYQVRGCNVELELLPNCIGQGVNYTFRPYAERQTKTAHTAQELYAQLPIGAARLASKLKGAKVIRTDYMLVGTSSLPAGRSVAKTDLRGDCSRATHVVSSVFLGGFQMMAGQAAEMSGSANIFSAGAGSNASSSGERLDSAGDVDACQSASKDGRESAQCAVPLRIGILALEEGATAPAPAPALAASTPASRPATPEPRTAPAPASTPAAIPATPGASTPSPQVIKVLANAELREALTKTPIVYVSGKADIDPVSAPTLQRVLAVAKENPQLKLMVGVHTNAIGDDSFNKRLTDARAIKVREWLVKNGLDGSRVEAAGWGEEKPIADNQTVEGRKKNNRTEFWFD